MSPRFSRTRLSRRQFAVWPALPVAAAASRPYLAHGQAPTVLSLLLASSAVPGANEYTLQLATSWSEANGVLIDIEFAELHDLPARVDRVLRGGEARDIVELQDLQPFRHPTNLVNLSHVADEIIAEQGPFPEWATRTVRVQNNWLSLPIGAVTTGIVYRPSHFTFANVDPSTMTTWDGYFAAAASVATATGTPSALALAQSPVAAPGFAYAAMWSHGAMELQPGSREVSFDTPELHAALTATAKAMTNGFLPEATAWNDIDLVRAFASGQVASTIAGPDAYLALRVTGDADVGVQPMPAGPAGRFVPLGSRSLGISARSEAIETATEFLRWWRGLAQYSQWIVAHQGAIVPVNESLLQTPMFSQDGNVRSFVDVLTDGRTKGYAAAPSPASAEVAANTFVVNTFADAARGVDVVTAANRGKQLIAHFFTESR